MTKNEELAKWSSAYQLPQYVAAHPSQLAVVQSSIPVRASVFEAYVGAVFSESGIDLVSHWVKLLIRRVLEIDDIAQRTPRSELSPLARIADPDAGSDDMNERILVRLDAMSIAESNSTGVGGGTGGYNYAMNQFSTRSIGPSSHDGSFNTPATTTSSFLSAANAQPIAVATGRRKEIRDYEPGHYSPSQLPFAPNSQYAPDTRHNVPSYTHQNSGQSPQLPSGDESNRSSSSSTVRPPARTPQDSPSSSKATVSPSVSSPSEPGHYSPNFPGHHSPSHLPFAPNSQYAPDTRHNVPSYTHQNSGQSPQLPSGDRSNRSSSSNTVRPPARTPRDYPSSSNATVSPSVTSPSVTSPSVTNSSSSGQSDFSTSSTRSVAGGYLALFNQMATQKKEKVEWKISSSGPPHKPKFDAQVFGKCFVIFYLHMH